MEKLKINLKAFLFIPFLSKMENSKKKNKNRMNGMWAKQNMGIAFVFYSVHLRNIFSIKFKFFVHFISSYFYQHFSFLKTFSFFLFFKKLFSVCFSKKFSVFFQSGFIFNFVLNIDSKYLFFIKLFFSSMWRYSNFYYCGYDIAPMFTILAYEFE